MPHNTEFDELLGKASAAARGGEKAWSVQSTGEKLAVAIVLDRHDWLARMGYTMAEAIRRVGSEWTAMLPDIASELDAQGLLKHE